MNSDSQSGSEASEGRRSGRRGGAAARLRLIRRVVDHLLPLDEADLEADVENPSLRRDDSAPRLLRTDLMLTALDLRVRMSVLPDDDAGALDSPDIHAAALGLLLAYQKTACVVLVADDEALTSVLVEPSDRADSLIRAEGVESTRSVRRGPVGDIVRSYLRQVAPGWEAVAPIISDNRDFRLEARAIARAALEDVQSGNKNITEWKTARANLSELDARWAEDLALSIRRGDHVDIDTCVTTYVAGGRKP